jgi:hypothetical protein
MLVLEALFDHIQQISSRVEIIGSLVQRSPVSASDVRDGSTSEELGLSKCLPGYTRQRTSLDAVGRSQTCH